jgi:hypothetical protein
MEPRPDLSVCKSPLLASLEHRLQIEKRATGIVSERASAFDFT